MPVKWIVIANSNAARFFEIKGKKSPLQELKILLNPDYRIHEQKLTSDLPGRVHDRYGEGRHRLEPRSSPKAHTAFRFARQIAQELHQGRVGNCYHQLILIAPAQMLGLLHKRLHTATAKCVIGELDLNITHLKLPDIRKFLNDKL